MLSIAVCGCFNMPCLFLSMSQDHQKRPPEKKLGPYFEKLHGGSEYNGQDPPGLYSLTRESTCLKWDHGCL
jgi:hypothetical protein